MCAEMVVIHKAVGAQQFAAQLIGRGFLRGGVLDIVSHRISRCIPINFFIQIVGTIRTPQDSGKKLDILQRVFCRKSAWFILLIVYNLNHLCFFSSQEGGIFLNRFTGKCAEATAAHDLCTAIFVCLLLQRPDSQIDCRLSAGSSAVAQSSSLQAMASPEEVPQSHSKNNKRTGRQRLTPLPACSKKSIT